MQSIHVLITFINSQITIHLSIIYEYVIYKQNNILIRCYISLHNSCSIICLPKFLPVAVTSHLQLYKIKNWSCIPAWWHIEEPNENIPTSTKCTAEIRKKCR